MGGKICLMCKGKKLLGIVNKFFVFKSLLTTPSNVLPLYLKQTFLPIIRIFTEGDGMESRLSSYFFFTLLATYPSDIHGRNVQLITFQHYSRFQIVKH